MNGFPIGVQKDNKCAEEHDSDRHWPWFVVMLEAAGDTFGWGLGERYYLYNHLKLDLKYHSSPVLGDETLRVVA